MNIQLELCRRVLIVRLSGELDHHTAGRLRDMVEQELDREVATSVLLSLQGLTFMDSSGLGVILGRYRRLNQAGGRMAACCLTPQVLRIFELSGLTRIISIYRTEEQALEQL
ncbi:MAG: anti-sigma F factor antagonist [Bacillota bacterium]|jgi:stage II sporulation protein AA (anti-sigma F factor antagonist)